MRAFYLVLVLFAIGCQPQTEKHEERVVVKFSDMTADEEKQYETDIAAAEKRVAELKQQIEASDAKAIDKLGAANALNEVASQHIARSAPLYDGRVKAAKWYREELESLTVDGLIERRKNGFSY